MKLSVIIPVFNTRKYLERCVISVLGNQGVDLELIIVDDGSTDGTDVLCNQLAERHQQVSVIHIDNSGPATAKDRGLDWAKGDYVALIDSDDAVQPDMFVRMMDAARRYQADIVCCNYSEVYEDGTTREFHYSHQEYLLEGTEGARRFLMKQGIYTQCWTKIFRRQLIEDHHIRHLEGMRTDEDFVFNIQCMMKSRRVVVVDEPLYIYTNRESSLSRDYFRKDIGSYIDNRWRRFELTGQLVAKAGQELRQAALFNQLFYCNELLGRIALFPELYHQQQARRVTHCMKSHPLMLWKHRQMMGLSLGGLFLLLLLPTSLYMRYRGTRIH